MTNRKERRRTEPALSEVEGSVPPCILHGSVKEGRSRRNSLAEETVFSMDPGFRGCAQEDALLGVVHLASNDFTEDSFYGSFFAMFWFHAQLSRK